MVDTATSSSTEDPLQDTAEPSTKFVAPMKRESRKSGKWQREREGSKKTNKNKGQKEQREDASPLCHMGGYSSLE